MSFWSPRLHESEDELRALMIAGLGGDATAHHALLTAVARLLRSFFLRRHRDAGDVEDLVQDTLIAIHTRRVTYDTSRPVTAWIYAIARYKLIDHLRKSRLETNIEDLADILTAEGFESAISARMDVDRMLDSLPAKQAAAIRDTRLDGLSIAEAAAQRGISESDVKISVHRGLKALASRLKGGR
jgi:RNA polymerase sigma factor (sigma-70 family)